MSDVTSGSLFQRPSIQAKEVVCVLAVSHGAAEVIKQVVASAQIPGDGGVRISGQPIDEQSVKLDLSLAPSPEPGDAVVEQEGANVFVEESLAPLLEDKVLDAEVEGEGVSFAIVSQQQDRSSNGQPDDYDSRDIS